MPMIGLRVANLAALVSIDFAKKISICEDPCKATPGAAAFQSQPASLFLVTRSLNKLHGSSV